MKYEVDLVDKRERREVRETGDGEVEVVHVNKYLDPVGDSFVMHGISLAFEVLKL